MLLRKQSWFVLWDPRFIAPKFTNIVQFLHSIVQLSLDPDLFLRKLAISTFPIIAGVFVQSQMENIFHVLVIISDPWENIVFFVVGESASCS